VIGSNSRHRARDARRPPAQRSRKRRKTPTVVEKLGGWRGFEPASILRLRISGSEAADWRLRMHPRISRRTRCSNESDGGEPRPAAPRSENPRRAADERSAPCCNRTQRDQVAECTVKLDARDCEDSRCAGRDCR